MENPNDHILVEDGEMFDGSRDQFCDCFFDNADNLQITDWCKSNEWTLTINDVKILTRESFLANQKLNLN